ncbi:MAG: phosphatidate cytidylyltransferase [Bacteroidota bacterium]
MKDLQIRTLWGILFVAILTGAILFGPYTFALLFVLLSFFILREFYGLTVQAGYSPQIYPGLLTGVMLFILSFFLARHTISIKSLIVLLPIIFSFPVYELFRKKKSPIANIAITGFGILYISVPFSILNFFVFSGFPGNISYNFSLLISIFIFIWVNDSGAYLFGVKYGRHRLFERISPKKSWEGFLGGLITSVIAASIISVVFSQYSFSIMVLIAIVTVITGTLGDMVESMIKRSVGVKDSGRFIPGDGGLLDRFDSLLLASPVIFFILQFLP